MSEFGPSLQFAAAQQFSRFRSEAVPPVAQVTGASSGIGAERCIHTIAGRLNRGDGERNKIHPSPLLPRTHPGGAGRLDPYHHIDEPIGDRRILKPISKLRNANPTPADIAHSRKSRSISLLL